MRRNLQTVYEIGRGKCLNGHYGMETMVWRGGRKEVGVQGCRVDDNTLLQRR